MKRIALVANSSWYIYNLRLGLIKALQEFQVNITVIAPPDDFTIKLIREGCNFINIKVDNKGKNPLRDIQLYYSLKQIYRKQHFDLIFHYTIKPNIFGSLAASATDQASIAVISGTGHSFIKRNLLFQITKRLYRLALRRCDEVWFVNNDDKALFLEKAIIGDNYNILPGEGVNVSYFSPKPAVNRNEYTNFLFSGRLIGSKGINEYIEAAKIIKNRYPNTHFQILGYFDVPNPTSLTKKEILAHHLEGTIEYLGFTDDVRPFIAETDCFIFPSYYGEGTPRSLLESASMEIPIITTHNVGCKDVVEDGHNGFLCKPRDVKALVSTIEAFLELNDEARRQMGRNGRKKILLQFDEQLVISHYLRKLGFRNRNKKGVKAPQE
ncbi:MAG: glycosyltransferase family 4 protein [Bacteroidota bacterium]